ncbi:MAG: YkuS family protein [Clostridia bacterium]|nr:YkuS family protein [Clostridia bacterium]
MVVAFQKGLENLQNQLRTHGFDTVTYGEYPYPIDALVYMESIDISSVANTASEACDKKNTSGIFLVNAHNKSSSDIASILKRKMYSPLF